MLSFGSSTVDFWLTPFPLAKSRQTKGVVKLHLLPDNDGYLPAFVVIPAGMESDVIPARCFPLPVGNLTALDGGYYEFRLFRQWNESGVFFVTGTKGNASFDVAEN